MNILNSKYRKFESNINEIINKCDIYKIKNYYIDDDGFLIVYGDVNLSDKKLIEIPFSFREIFGDFDISYNDLNSLIGCPKTVHKSFKISGLKICNLKHGPYEVGRGFIGIEVTNLEDISNFPQHLGGAVILYGCGKLKSLRGLPDIVMSTVDISGCHNIKTLRYGPKIVYGHFFCINCDLFSLYGAPEFVGGNFVCRENKLALLKHSPKFIDGNFDFSKNKISSFYNFPDYVGGRIKCDNNPINNVWKLFEDKEHIDYFNQMKIISDDGKRINIKRLNVFLNSIGKESVEYVEGYENI